MLGWRVEYGGSLIGDLEVEVKRGRGVQGCRG